MFLSEALVARRAAERNGGARASGGIPSLLLAFFSSSVRARSLFQSVSLLLLRGVPARVLRGRFADRCRRFQSCRTRSSCTSSYPDRGTEVHRPLSHACVTAATGGSAPSNPRVNARFTSCSCGLEPPDRKISPALFSVDGLRQNLVES